MARVAQRYANPRLQDIRRLDAEVLHLVAAKNVVFTERVDHHFDADGVEVLSTRLTGVMEFDDHARCTSWREYHDPAYFTGRPTPGWGPGQPTALAPAESAIT
jgi:limonene-1,2-epoxide hydrolase